MTHEELLTAITSARDAQLRTYRRDGSAVDTLIRFALDGDSLVFRTKLGPKTRRISVDPAVELCAQLRHDNRADPTDRRIHDRLLPQT